MPKHDNPYAYFAYQAGQEAFIRGDDYDPNKFKDEQRQAKYTFGYNQELVDCSDFIRV